MTSAAEIPQAAQLLHNGGVIAYPTEAVWGLGCDPRNQAAVLRLLALKQREVDKGLILIAASEGQLAHYIDMTSLGDAQLAAVRSSWPGPHTWIVPASESAPPWITGRHAGIAVRVSAHPEVVALCNAFGSALVSTSANRTGDTPPEQIAALDPRIRDGVDAVLEGESGGQQRPTQIRDAVTGRALRT